MTEQPTTPDVVVPVRIPAHLMPKLLDLADVYDMRLNDMLLELAVQAAHRGAPDMSDPVVHRWRLGWSDKQIAIDLDMTNTAVRDRRYRLGLPANSNRSPAYRERNRAS